MESSHVTDDVSAPAVHDDDYDDANNPFFESPSTPSTSSTSDCLAKFHPGTYLRKLQSARHHGDGVKMADSGSGSWWRGASWSSVVHVVLVSGRQMSLLDGTGDVYVKFKFASERYTTRVKPKSSSLQWLEQLQFHVPATPPTCSDVIVTSSSPRRPLDVSLRSRDLASRDRVLGLASVDVLSLDKDETHDIEVGLDRDAGLLRLLVTVSDSRLTTDGRHGDESTRPQRRPRVDHHAALTKYNGLLNSFRNLSDVGWLEVKVVQASGLSAADVRGTSDPYCVLQLVNSRRQTHTEYRTLCPQWNRAFTFDVTDIHAVLEVIVYDENPDKKVDFLGKVAIPLLRIVAGKKRWYQLKDVSLSCRVKGCIQLEMDVVFNNFKAAVRTFNPRQTQYTVLPDKFRVSLMRRNMARLKKIIHSLQPTLDLVVDCLEWRSRFRSSVALLAFSAVVLLCEPFMIPVVLLLIFLKTLFVQRVRKDLQRADNDETAAEVEDLDVELDDKDAKVEKKGVVEKLQTLQDTCLQVQQSMDVVASTIERAENVVTWRVPWLSWLAVISLTVTTVVFYVLPLRYVLLVWGVVKLTAKLRRPDTVHHVGLVDFLARVPSNRQLTEYRELTCGGSDKKKKQ